MKNWRFQTLEIPSIYKHNNNDDLTYDTNTKDGLAWISSYENLLHFRIRI